MEEAEHSPLVRSASADYPSTGSKSSNTPAPVHGGTTSAAAASAAAPPTSADRCTWCSNRQAHYQCDHCAHRLCRRCVKIHDDPDDCVLGGHRVVDLSSDPGERHPEQHTRRRDPQEEKLRLQALHNLGVLNSPPDHRIDRLVKKAAQFTQSQCAAITFVNSNHIWFKSHIGFSAERAQRQDTLSSYVVDNTAEGVFEVTNWRKHPRFRTAPYIPGLDGTQFFAGTSIRCPLTGQPVGVLCVLDVHPRRLSRFQRGAMEMIAEQVALVLKVEFIQTLLRNRREKYRQEVQKLKRECIHANLLRNRSADFLCATSHETLTSLSGIVSMVKLLKDAKNLTPEQIECLDCIDASGAHLQAILSDVMDVNKVEREQIVLENKSFSLRQLIDDVVNMTYNVMDPREPLYVFLDPALPEELVGDTTRIKQILVNYISNSIKHCRERSHISIHIKLTSPPEDPVRQVCFVVQDTGEGIAEADQQHLFDAFHQSGNGDKPREKRPAGWGLGLAIVYYLAQRMGGTVGARSELGQGSQFYVNLTLPIPQELITPPAGRLLTPRRAKSPMAGGDFRHTGADPHRGPAQQQQLSGAQQLEQQQQEADRAAECNLHLILSPPASLGIGVSDRSSPVAGRGNNTCASALPSSLPPGVPENTSGLVSACTGSSANSSRQNLARDPGQDEQQLSPPRPSEESCLMAPQGSTAPRSAAMCITRSHSHPYSPQRQEVVERTAAAAVEFRESILNSRPGASSHASVQAVPCAGQQSSIHGSLSCPALINLERPIPVEVATPANGTLQLPSHPRHRPPFGRPRRFPDVFTRPHTRTPFASGPGSPHDLTPKSAPATFPPPAMPIPIPAHRPEPCGPAGRRTSPVSGISPSTATQASAHHGSTGSAARPLPRHTATSPSGLSFSSDPPDLYLPDSPWLTAEDLLEEARKVAGSGAVQTLSLEPLSLRGEDSSPGSAAAAGKGPAWKEPTPLDSIDGEQCLPPLKATPETSAEPPVPEPVSPSWRRAVLYLMSDELQALSLYSLIPQRHRAYLVQAWTELPDLLKANRDLQQVVANSARADFGDENHAEGDWSGSSDGPPSLETTPSASPVLLPSESTGPEARSFLALLPFEVRTDPTRQKEMRAAGSWFRQPIRMIVIDANALPRHCAGCGSAYAFTPKGALALALTPPSISRAPQAPQLQLGSSSPPTKDACDRGLHGHASFGGPAGAAVMLDESPFLPPGLTAERPCERVSLDSVVGVAKGLAQRWAETMGSEVLLPPLMLLASAADRSRLLQNTEVQRLYHCVMRKPLSTVQARRVFQLVLDPEAEGQLQKSCSPNEASDGADSSPISLGAGALRLNLGPPEVTSPRPSQDAGTDHNEASDEAKDADLSAMLGSDRSADPRVFRLRGNVRVILADDHRLNRIFMSRLLQRIGYSNVETAANGLEVLELIREGRARGEDFHLIIMDKNMPQMDGCQATIATLAQYREWNSRCPPGQYYEPPVILALSASCSEKDINSLHEAGVAAYLQKPIDSEELAQIMDRWSVLRWHPELRSPTGAQETTETTTQRSSASL